MFDLSRPFRFFVCVEERCMHPSTRETGLGWCISCLDAMSIRCAWCGLSIYICDPVTLYTPKDLGKLPLWRVLYDGEDLKHAAAVGCLRMNCADTGADRAGFWMPGEDGRGRVARVASPYEVALWTGAVVINDLSDINEAVKHANAAHDARAKLAEEQKV